MSNQIRALNIELRFWFFMLLLFLSQEVTAVPFFHNVVIICILVTIGWVASRLVEWASRPGTDMDG